MEVSICLSLLCRSSKTVQFRIIVIL